MNIKFKAFTNNHNCFLYRLPDLHGYKRCAAVFNDFFSCPELETNYSTPIHWNKIRSTKTKTLEIISEPTKGKQGNIGQVVRCENLTYWKPWHDISEI